MDAPESEIPEVTDECIGTVAKRERVAPEEPLAFKPHQQAAEGTARAFTHLERHNSDDRDRKENERKRILSPQEAGVEESHSGDHQPHKGGTRKSPSNITTVVDPCLAIWVGVCELTR